MSATEPYEALKLRREVLVGSILPVLKASRRFGTGPTTNDVYMREAFEEADRIIAESDRRQRDGQ